MRKRKAYNIKSRIVSALRKIWMYSPLRREALQRAEVKQDGQTLYRCAINGKLYTKDNVTVDHIEPVVGTKHSTKGQTVHEVDWTGYVKRMFVGVEGLQVISREAHDAKTQTENKARRVCQTKKKTRSKKD